jgi:hypothetical protein
MKFSFESKGGFNKASKWLDDISNTNTRKLVDKVSKEGTNSLSINTPRSTGETAASWKEKVTVTDDTIEVAWINEAHPESDVSVAKLIETGHGTRTGGYVPAKPYIKDAMKPVWSKLDKEVRKELRK